jgi:PAS domain S-box-containing protein
MSDRPAVILVVDDDPNARLLMGAALRKAGFEVRSADGGAQALLQFRASPSDLVMLDVDMPDIDGYQVCAALRAEAGALLPIVMVTGMDDVASVEAAYLHGATDFVAKPVNWALIGHRVRYLLRGQQTLLDLQAAEARNAAILNAIPDLLFELDIDGRYLDFRAPRTELLAAPSDTLIGRTVSEVLPADAAAVCLAALHEAREQGTSSGRQFELPIGGRSLWFELSVSLKSAQPGRTPSFIVLSRDITERKEAEARIARLAFFDSLTGLANRRSFIGRVDSEIRRAAQDGKGLAILFMDLDGFKNINDSLGHAAGDQILKLAAERLREGLRPSDLLSRPQPQHPDDTSERADLARLGGDEFTALILDVERPEHAVAVASRIGQLMRRPFALDGRELTLTASIGIALYPDNGGDAATLLKHADTAMYQAKRSGRDNTQLYSPLLTHAIQQRLALDADLRLALDQQQFHLVYQPQVEAGSGRVLAMEALIRWRHPQRGIVAPLEFIALAEENGLIDPIGLWVLHTACAEAVRWSQAGTPVDVAVNLSPRQFAQAGLPQRVFEVLDRTGLPPQRLELEVTEGALMENTAATQAALTALRERGVRIALDDFGTGYSSLSYLTRMPISRLKVDRCFVADLLQGGESEAIVRAVLAMARSLGLRVTAEGVETRAQAMALKAMACDDLQGYHFSRPVPAAAVPALLRQLWPLEATPATSPPSAAD